MCIRDSGDTSETDRTTMLTSYQTRNTGGTYTIVEVSVANLVNFNEINELFGKAVSSSGVVSDYTPSDSVANAQYSTDWKYKMYEAFLVYNDSSIPTSRQTWWQNVRPKLSATLDGSTVNLVDPSDGLRVTDIWIYHQVALGDRLADRSFLPSITDTVRTTALTHLETMIRTLGRTWYGVITGTSATIQRHYGDWLALSTADATVIYSDLITNTGAVRTPDGSYLPIATTIATGFKPDTPTLR